MTRTPWWLRSESITGPQQFPSFSPWKQNLGSFVFAQFINRTGRARFLGGNIKRTIEWYFKRKRVTLSDISWLTGALRQPFPSLRKYDRDTGYIALYNTVSWKKKNHASSLGFRENITCVHWGNYDLATFLWHIKGFSNGLVRFSFYP